MRHGPRALSTPRPLILTSALVGFLGCRTYGDGRQYGRLTPMAEITPRGLARIRTDEARVATFRWLASNLSRHCGGFVCNTGFNSLYSWVGSKSPSPIVIGNSLDLYTDEQQHEIARALRDSPNPCAIYHPTFFYIPGAERSSPLLDEFRNAYVSCGEVDQYEFRVRADRPLPVLVDCVRPGPVDGGTSTASLTLTPVPGRTAYRMCLVDTADGSILADTRRPGAPPPSRWRTRRRGESYRPPR